MRPWLCAIPYWGLGYVKLTPQIWKKISSKTVHQSLVPKYDGPFEVVHLTFHVSFLKKCNQEEFDAVRQKVKRPPPPPPMVCDQFEKQVAKILDHKIKDQGKKNQRTEGESVHDAAWIRGALWWQFEEKIDEYWNQRGEVFNPPSTRTTNSSGGRCMLAL